MIKILPILIYTFLFTAQPDAYASQDGAKKYVQGLSDKVVSIIVSKSDSDAAKEAKLKKMFHENVNTEWMSRFVLGRYYRQASAAQKKKYVGLYKDFLVQSYIPRFKEYAGEEFKIIGAKDKGDKQFIVETELAPKSSEAPAVRVDYRLVKEGDKYRVIDIVGEGISLITTQRSDFGGLISQKGLDFFLTKLEEKVKKLKKQVAKN